MDLSKYEIKDDTKLIVKIFDDTWAFTSDEEVIEIQEEIKEKFFKIIDEDKVLFIFTSEKDNVEIYTINE